MRPWLCFKRTSCAKVITDPHFVISPVSEKLKGLFFEKTRVSVNFCKLCFLARTFQTTSNQDCIEICEKPVKKVFQNSNSREFRRENIVDLKKLKCSVLVAKLALILSRRLGPTIENEEAKKWISFMSCKILARVDSDDVIWSLSIVLVVARRHATEFEYRF